MKVQEAYGFGVMPYSRHQFYIVVPEKMSGDVEIYEQYGAFAPDIQQHDEMDDLRFRLKRSVFSKISTVVASEFNRRLKENKMKGCRFKVGETCMDNLFGKELLLLLWGFEGQKDDAVIQRVLTGWKGLLPEERWYLYTMTNAATGGLDNDVGWRKAVKCILGES